MPSPEWDRYQPKEPPRPEPKLTAREAGKDVLRPYVRRRVDLLRLISRPLIVNRPAYAAQIGGEARVIRGPREPWELVPLAPDELAVTRLGRRAVFARFPVATLWRELEDELGGRQGRLF